MNGIVLLFVASRLGKLENPLRVVGRPLLAALGSTGAVLLLRLHGLGGLAVFLILYVALTFFLRVMDAQDILLLRSLLGMPGSGQVR